MIVTRGFGKGNYLSSIVGSGFARKSIGVIIVEIFASLYGHSGLRVISFEWYLIKAFTLSIAKQIGVNLER